MKIKSQPVIEAMQFYTDEAGECWTIQHGRIVNPGKFEGERPYVVYYWEEGGLVR